MIDKPLARFGRQHATSRRHFATASILVFVLLAGVSSRIEAQETETGDPVDIDSLLNDVVGRFGGEEFIILLPHTTAADATSVAERIRGTILRENCYWQGQQLNITLSLGVAEAGPLIDTHEELIKAADQALYSAKNTGRNKTVTAEVTQWADRAPFAEVRAA